MTESILKRFLILALLLVPLTSFAQERRSNVPGVRANAAPPAPRAEVQSARPSPNHSWVAGHWAWRNNRHEWMVGHWALPPGPGYIWERERWVNEGGNWMFYEGHWRMEHEPQANVAYVPPPPPPQPVYVQQQPPQQIAESPPPQPFGGAIWINGFWNWNGQQYMWVGGHWSAPHDGANWESHRWENRNGQWVMVPGHWRSY